MGVGATQVPAGGLTVWANCRARDCAARVDDPDRGAGEPAGWLRLSISLPPLLDRTGHQRPYRMVGEYCSLACLVEDWDRVIAGDAAAQRDLARLQQAQAAG